MTSTLSFSDVATSAGGGEDPGINLNDFITMRNKIQQKETEPIYQSNRTVQRLRRCLANIVTSWNIISRNDKFSAASIEIYNIADRFYTSGIIVQGTDGFLKSFLTEARKLRNDRSGGD